MNEKIKAKNREKAKVWYKNNRERKLKWLKEYYKLNPDYKERNIARKKRWIEEHRAEWNKYQRELMRKRLNIKPENYRK